MDHVDVNEVEGHFFRLLERVEAGEEIVISRAGQPIARLIPCHPEAKERKPGIWRGKVTIADEFDETPDWLIAAFDGQERVPPG